MDDAVYYDACGGKLRSIIVDAIWLVGRIAYAWGYYQADQKRTT
ncbi:hypothetical protein [Nostoc sp. NOS(2021)]|nr:hypothetical protein [Nostoc sp. NOS(2021)]